MNENRKKTCLPAAAAAVLGLGLTAPAQVPSAPGAGPPQADRVREAIRKATAYLLGARDEKRRIWTAKFGEETDVVLTSVVALAALGLAGERGEAYRKGVDYFARHAPAFCSTWKTDSPSGHHAAEFCLFFGTIAARRRGGKIAAAWSRELNKALPGLQHPDGGWELEQDPRRRGTRFSKLFCTATALFALEAPRAALFMLRAQDRPEPPRPGMRFDGTLLDRKRWKVPDALARRLLARLDLGRRFFRARDRKASVARLEALGLDENARPDIGWIVPSGGRYLGTPLSRTLRDLRAMSAGAFAREYAASRDRSGGYDIGRALERFRKRHGIELEPPRFAAHETAAVVRGVAKRSPAANRGLEPGDRIVAVEGAPVPEWNDFIFRVNGYGPGSMVKLTVAPARGGENVARYLRIGEAE